MSEKPTGETREVWTVETWMDLATGETKRRIEKMGTESDKPTTQDLILLEVRDLTASLGELRMQLNGVWQRVVALEGRVRNLESGPTISIGVGGELVEETRTVERTRTAANPGEEQRVGDHWFTVTPLGWEA